jgi:RNA polymerase sigma-70 factor (ECF subfamily)
MTPVRGADQVARCLTELLGPETLLSVEAVNGQPGVVLRTLDGAAEKVVAVLSLKVAGPKVATVWIVLNPDKLRHWQARE